MTEEKKSKFQVQVEALVAEWEVDSLFPSDVAAEIKRGPILHNKYYVRLLRTRMKMRDVNTEYEDLEFKKNLYYTGRGSAEDYKKNPQNFNINKGELPMWMKADTELKYFRYQIECLKEMEKILNEIIHQINERHWKLKTLLEAEKFKAGIG
jgi:hypothetical protein